MQSLLEIRRRIKGVREIRHITGAMKLVAATHLKRAQERVNNARPFARKISEVLVDLNALPADSLHPLMQVRPVNRVLYVVVTSDKGLAGSYNQSIIRATTDHIHSLAGTPATCFIAVGKKGLDYFRRMNMEVVGEYTGISRHPAFSHAVQIAGQVMQMYRTRQVDEVYMVYSRFYSVTVQRPRHFRLLPIIPIQSEIDPEEAAREWIFEPSPVRILDHLVPRYVETEIYRALLEADAGERGARMTSMSAASDNAEKLINELVIKYNHSRQSIITREITELAGGAELIRKDAEDPNGNGGT